MLVRIVPASDNVPFPYDEAKRVLIIENPDCIFEQADLRPMIEAGRRFNWTAEMIKANQELHDRGNCLKFRVERKPFLDGTLFEDNIMFDLTNVSSHEDALREITRLAKLLGATVFRH